jgi:hypothetical protein
MPRKRNPPGSTLTRTATPKETRIPKTQAKQKFIEVLGKVYGVAVAAEAIGRDRTTMYHWRAEDPEFAKQWDAALESCLDRIESVHVASALEPGPSNISRIHALKARRPAQWNEVQRQQVEHVNQPILPAYANPGLSELAAAAAKLLLSGQLVPKGDKADQAKPVLDIDSQEPTTT